MDEIGTEAWNERNIIEDLERLKLEDKDLPLAFCEYRHTEKIEGLEWKTQTWRMKERMKTVSVALVLCLNVGVDPPDIVKTTPCAKLECWIDPTTTSGPKALENIGLALQAQYERWQPRARYKQSLDPTTEEVRKLCVSLRRNAKEERVLFHYNGHGVPKPTTNGEIWVFNRTYTQYIPLSIYDLQSWMGSPSIYVYDCPNAGIIVDSFKTFALQHEAEYQQQLMQSSSSRSSPTLVQQSAPSYKECIQLAACSANQCLPMNPDLPADLFTACLTTPIKIALRWCVLQPAAKLIPNISLEMVDKVPGTITDRKSMFGELNWIFTAITDTIAWNTLPRDLFHKLFRQDLLVASLFRNFLLAERIMKSYDCTPVSSPVLPATNQNDMWDAWDSVVDWAVVQLPLILRGNAEYENLSFFEDQLTAFEVWLQGGADQRERPIQLPIVLQVLLSQVHRTRALELLGKFLAFGPWAVNLALSVGIFPYVLKLLQSFAKDLRPLLVLIWSKILAVDNTCQADLIREQGHKYFLSILQDPTMSSETRTQATFILSCLVTDYPDGQEAALQGSLISICLEQLRDRNTELKRSVAICLGKLWDHYENARWTGVRDSAHEKLYVLLKDSYPEVRAAAVYALGTFINAVIKRSEHANTIDHSIGMTLVNHAANESSSLVRQELINSLQWLVLHFDIAFVAVASKTEAERSPQESLNSSSNTLPRITTSRERLTMQQQEQNSPSTTFRRIPSSPTINNLYSPSSTSNLSILTNLPGLGYGSVYMKIWVALNQLEVDPHPNVARMCRTVTEYIRNLVKEERELIIMEQQRNSSLSLPPSPNRSGYLGSGDTGDNNNSPPSAAQMYQSGDFGSRFSTIHHRFSQRRQKKRSIDETTGRRKALVKTNFLAWCSKQFVIRKIDEYNDPESQKFHERDWRQIRNATVRKESLDEQKRVITSRIDTSVFNTRTALPPALLQLHPYSQHIAVAGNDSFAIWDFGTGAKTTAQQQKCSIRGRNSKITALEWINGHDLNLLMVAADDGTLRVWRPNIGAREPTLVAAWQAFNNFNANSKNEDLLLITWEQWTQTVIATGDTKILRLFDVEREMRINDLITGTDLPVTCLDSSYSGSTLDLNLSNSKDWTMSGNSKRIGHIVIGCADGSVRIFDRRCNPQDSKVKTWVEHHGSVLAVQLKDNLIISGSVDGDVKLYDIRKNDSLHTNQAIVKTVGMSCMSIHRSANAYACAAANQCINIFSLNGNALNTIRLSEGFVFPKVSSINCLNFHPHKVALAFGTADCSVNIYSLDTNSRR